MRLEEMGWDNYFQEQFNKLQNQDFIPARVAREHKNIYFIYTEKHELAATVSGRFRYKTRDYGDFPAVGDWVAVRVQEEGKKAIIHSVLPRKSNFSRKVAGFKTEEQVLAANVDTVFLVNGLDDNFNIRRIERYITIAWDSGATPVIILNKSDLCSDVAMQIEKVETDMIGVPVLAMSAAENEGIDQLNPYLFSGKTAVFLGSSGVGKSSIINCLLGCDHIKTGEVRESDSKGRHTTTYREMLFIPDGGIVIDTPGMRELQLWSADDGFETTFGDIEELAAKCRFNDCSHGNEPGCAIQEAVETGELDMGRFQSYLKLQGEMVNLSDRLDDKVYRQLKKDRNKQISKWIKEQKNMLKKDS